jgi:hypothetical protein
MDGPSSRMSLHRRGPASALPASVPSAPRGLLGTLTMRRADRIQPYFFETSAQAILRTLGWRF